MASSNNRFRRMLPIQLVNTYFDAKWHFCCVIWDRVTKTYTLRVDNETIINTNLSMAANEFFAVPALNSWTIFFRLNHNPPTPGVY